MLSYTYIYWEIRGMGNLLLSVNIIGGIWETISGFFSGVGSYLSTNFVPVADAAWTATANVVTSIPAFCLAHPGAIVFGAVGLIAGVKLAKVAVRGVKKLFSSIKSGIKNLMAKDDMESIPAPAPAPAKEKKAEPAKAAAPAKAKSAAPSKNIVSDYMMSLSTQDNLRGYRDFRQSRANVKPTSYIQTNNNPLYGGYHTVSPRLAQDMAGMSRGREMEDDFVMER